ncbi:MAG: NAD-dependent epimerase/dehydratase family protein [Bacteroidia bacterium]|nr:NAD-dependent epimerase/dehydratase family protein [Bacteroidia bacterium]
MGNNSPKLTNLAGHLIHISTPLNIVSGATGFLGAHVVCQLLQVGKTVSAFKRHTSDLKEFQTIFDWYISKGLVDPKAVKNLHWVLVDVLDVDTLNDTLKGGVVVYHCAAMVSFDPDDREMMMNINVEGTANMVNLSLLNGIKQFCHVSSIASLGRKKSREQITESNHWEDSKLNSNYAISKYKAELEVWRAAEEGLNVVIVNPGVIIGVGDYTKGSNHLVQSVFKGMPFYSSGVNGYVDATDVARAMLLLVERNITHKRFVLVGANLSIREVFFSLADGFNKKRPSIQVKPWMAAIAWRINWVIRLFTKKGIAITEETARAATNESYYSSKKITSEINFTFTPIAQTIKECCASYLKQNKTI